MDDASSLDILVRRSHSRAMNVAHRDVFSCCLGVAVACLFLPTPTPAASADLAIVQNGIGEEAVYDSVNGYLWYWDLSLFANANYYQQMALIEQLNLKAYFGTTGWHLATDADMATLWSLNSQTIRQMFHPSHERYDGAYEWHYWSGRFGGSVYGDEHLAVQTAWGNFAFGPFEYAWPEIYYTVDGNGGQETGAWVVAVPEPGSAFLLLAFAGLGAVRRHHAGRRVAASN